MSIEREAGFVPPPYPYERLEELAQLAKASPLGLTDCSVGTPCDPPPDEVVSMLSASGAERGYPPSAGTASYLAAVSDYLSTRFSVSVGRDSLAACIGTKEVVASSAHYLRLRTPSKDTVLYPAISYPTYQMGAVLGSCRAVAVPPSRRDGSGLALDQVSEDDRRRAVMLWVNSPANPSGGLSDLGEAARWGRLHEIPVFSDECYAEFTWTGEPSTILSSGVTGVIAVHSLSKRSNLAGVRAGFLAGDPTLIAYLKSVRQHAGLMVPGPVQAAAIVAYGDGTHVDRQRERYRERLVTLATALREAGVDVALPDGGFYLWISAPPSMREGWSFARALAARCGLLCSPGEFYGEGAESYVRIAVVQSTARIESVAEAIASGEPFA